MILFGVRSPLVVEIEETLLRLGVAVTAAVSVSGTPRVIDRTHLVDLDQFSPADGDVFIAAAFGPARRAELISMGQELGMASAPALIDPTAILPRSLRVGVGTFINAGVVIGGMSIIGEGVLVNRADSVGHHCMLGNFVSIGPGATLAGNVHVGEGSVIGAGAVIQPDVRIGSHAVISAGTVVRKQVPDGALVAGNPAVTKAFKPKRSSLAVEGGE